jgi:hypothetical protein
VIALAFPESSVRPLDEENDLKLRPLGAPDDEMTASVLLAADMLGNIRAQTTRAFTASEMGYVKWTRKRRS